MNDKQLRATFALIEETRSLFHRLRVASVEVHGSGPVSHGRGVLMSLDDLGPRTVPQLARMRPVSRQHMRTVVNALRDLRLVELVDNPEHKRSRLVRLTHRGEDRVRTMRRREAEVLSGVEITAGETQLRSAGAVLREVRQLFESDEWSDAVSRPVARRKPGSQQPQETAP